MNYTLGCFNRPWADLSFDEALAGAARAGFDGLGLMRQRLEDGELHHLLSAESSTDDAVTLGSRITSAGLKPLVAFGNPGPELVDRASTAGFSHVLVATGYGEDLVAAVRRAEERDMTVLIKPHQGPCPTGRECVEVARRIGSRSFGIAYDPGNVMNAGATDPLSEIDEVAPWVKAVCVKDFDGETQFVTPGDGDVDFPAIFRALAASGFDGPVLVETVAKGDRDAVDREARRAHDFIATILKEIGG